MVSRTRLPRGKSSKPNGRLRSQISKEMSNLPTARVKKYAVLSDSTVADSPVLALSRDVAKMELETRSKMLGQWKKGTSKTALAKKALGFAQKGAQEFGKVITGVKAQELEEAIATACMSPEDKKKTLTQLRKERAESMELFPASQPLPAEDFSLTGNDLKKLRKEALG